MFDYMFDAPLNDEAYIAYIYAYIATVCVCNWEVTGTPPRPQMWRQVFFYM